MADTAPAENPGETPAKRPDGLPVGKPFEPGNNGNKGGRPKGLARRVREQVGDDGELLVDVMIQHATGWLLILEPPPYGREETAAQKKKREDAAVWQRVSTAEQQAAVRWLAERGFGKPAEYVPIDDPDPLGLTDDVQKLADAFDAAMDELAAKRREKIEAQQG